MISLHLQNKEYLDRVEEYEEESFIPHYLLDRREDEEAYWFEEMERENREWY